MRRQKKREMKELWSKQINAACREHGVKYSQFMHGLHISGSEINRKMLAELARTEPLSFYSMLQLSTLSRKVAAAGMNPQSVDEVALPYNIYDFPPEFDAEFDDGVQAQYDRRTAHVEESLHEALEHERQEDIKFEEQLKKELDSKKKTDDLYFGGL